MTVPNPGLSSAVQSPLLPILSALLLPLATARADLVAHVHISKDDAEIGVIDVILQHEKAPLAVANFITLAHGTRARIDATSGAPTFEPMYVGEKFFRIVNDPAFKIAQTGSGTGVNTGGPGFTFRDEFDPSLTHVPYVLSMANSGPNTNGSQIFFTGNASATHLNNVHTVFGLIPDPASRAVIDAIHAAGNNGSSISAITFERTDPAAVAFDEFAAGLPTVSPVASVLSVAPGDSVTAGFEDPLAGGTLLSIYRSTGLTTWERLSDRFAGYDNAPLASAELDQEALPRAFYHLAKVEHPGSPTPASLASRILVVNAPGAGGPITITFNDTGLGGTVLFEPTGDAPTTGDIGFLSHDPGGYGATLIVDSTNLIPLRLIMAYDQSAETQLSGRLTLSGFRNSAWSPIGSGTFTLTR